jgi:hypothetical protein
MHACMPSFLPADFKDQAGRTQGLHNHVRAPSFMSKSPHFQRRPGLAKQDAWKVCRFSLPNRVGIGNKRLKLKQAKAELDRTHVSFHSCGDSLPCELPLMRINLCHSLQPTLRLLLCLDPCCVITWIYKETLVSVFQTFQNQTTASPSYFKTILKELAVFNLRTSQEQVVVQLVKSDFFWINWEHWSYGDLKAGDVDGLSSLFILIRVGVCETKHL